jgi:hypothetical protein
MPATRPLVCPLKLKTPLWGDFISGCFTALDPPDRTWTRPLKNDNISMILLYNVKTVSDKANLIV